jgi:hypothetical protein
MTHLLQLGLVQSVWLGLGVLGENGVKLGLDEPAKSYIEEMHDVTMVIYIWTNVHNSEYDACIYLPSLSIVGACVTSVDPFLNVLYVDIHARRRSIILPALDTKINISY